MYSDDEDFIKVGRTYLEISERFKHIPYKYDILYREVDSAHNVVRMENYFKSYFKKYKYKPFKSFGGQFECFTKDSSEVIREAVLKIKYDKIVESGQFYELHSDLKMVWEEDKEGWVSLHNELDLLLDL